VAPGVEAVPRAPRPSRSAETGGDESYSPNVAECMADFRRAQRPPMGAAAVRRPDDAEQRNAGADGESNGRRRHDGMSTDSDLLAVLSDLGPDERRVLLVLAQRLRAGQKAYGRLDVVNDRRDWRRERAEELADALVYGAIAEVARAKRKS
jgi:hypothetical protein